MNKEMVEKIVGEDVLKRIGDKAYKATIDAYFMDSNDSDFPEDVFSLLEKYDKYDNANNVLSENHGIQLYPEYEDCTVDEINVYMYQHEKTMRDNMLEAVAIAFTAIKNDKNAMKMLQEA